MLSFNRVSLYKFPVSNDVRARILDRAFKNRGVVKVEVDGGVLLVDFVPLLVELCSLFFILVLDEFVRPF